MNEGEGWFFAEKVLLVLKVVFTQRWQSCCCPNSSPAARATRNLNFLSSPGAECKTEQPARRAAQNTNAFPVNHWRTGATMVQSRQQHHASGHQGEAHQGNMDGTS